MTARPTERRKRDVMARSRCIYEREASATVAARCSGRYVIRRRRRASRGTLPRVYVRIFLGDPQWWLRQPAQTFGDPVAGLGGVDNVIEAAADGGVDRLGVFVGEFDPALELEPPLLGILDGRQQRGDPRSGYAR